jgi:hypothetical protein
MINNQSIFCLEEYGIIGLPACFNNKLCWLNMLLETIVDPIRGGSFAKDW